MSESQGDRAWPDWLREIDALLAVYPQFVLSGNVRDRYLLPVEPVDGPEPVEPGEPAHAQRPARLEEPTGGAGEHQEVEVWPAESIAVALAAMLRRAGFDALLVHDIVDGYRILSDDQDAAWADARAIVGDDLRSARADDLDVLAQAVRSFAAGGGTRMGLALDYASRLTAVVENLGPREHAFFSSCLKSSHRAARHFDAALQRGALFNPVFWIVEREHDLPAWLTAGNWGMRAIPVPWPELAERERTAALLTGASQSPDRAQAAEQIAGRTEGMATASLFGITTLLNDQDIDYSDAEDAVRIYTLGAAESPWRRGAVAQRLRTQDVEATLSTRVLGQPGAVTKAADILRRAALGLSGAQAGAGSSRPRGVLFFAGPTGVGKTELAKALTELVFGTDDAYVRFDMSEFSSEHAGDRMVGAPPGYVGFEGGGELTNAVRQSPYSLLLFDEIEKAHPRILDKFLQLLDDGRLTDGRGTTVHFSDTLIVFTSNLGMTRSAHDGTGRRIPTVTPGTPHEEIEAEVTKEIRRHFTEEINRPELLNRVGDNLVVFDFIREPVAVEITDLMLEKIAERVEESADIIVVLSPQARNQIHALTQADLSFGGRGIGNVLESRYVNPLARALFAHERSPDSTTEPAEVVVVDLTVSSTGVPEVVLE